MQEQMRAFRQDFESERRDREQAQSRVATLESELTAVKQQVTRRLGTYENHDDKAKKYHATLLKQSPAKFRVNS